MTPGSSVAASSEKTNAAPWKSAARAAVDEALRTVGEQHATVTWRDGRFEMVNPWAAFDVGTTGDVVWVAQLHGEAPEGSLVVATEQGDMGVWRYPNDPALPGLPAAVTPGGLDSLLAEIAAGVDADVVDVVTLQPLQRAVVRVGKPPHQVFVKVLPPWRTREVADHHRRARVGGLPAPEVLTVDEARGLIVFQALTGSTLAEHLETGRPVPSAEDLWAFVQRLIAAVGTHGDLHDRQLIVDEQGGITGVVDFDDAGTGAPLDDLGRLIAHMAARGSLAPTQRDRVNAVVNEFTAVVARHVDAELLHQRVSATRRRLEAVSRTRGARAAS